MTPIGRNRELWPGTLIIYRSPVGFVHCEICLHAQITIRIGGVFEIRNNRYDQPLEGVRRPSGGRQRDRQRKGPGRTRPLTVRSGQSVNYVTGIHLSYLVARGGMERWLRHLALRASVAAARLG